LDKLSQLSFSFQNEEKYLEEEFVLLDENLAARNFLQKFFAQKDFNSSELQSLILKGERASGKTHLISIFVRKFGGEFLNLTKISSLNLASFFVQNRFYIFENFNEIEDEELLLHLINSAREAGSFLLLSASKKSDFKLKDLVSRLRNIVEVEIKNPQIESLEQLLINRLSRRQIRPAQKLIKSVLVEIKREYLAVDEAVKNYFLPNP
jgi:chromosomal replication initiation ATPase DnaA